MCRILSAACLAICVSGLAGCSAKPCAIRGTVTHGGEKLTWPDGGNLLVIYFPEDRTHNDNVYSAQTSIEDSSYSIAAIPPGRYTVAIQQFDKHFMDAFNKAYDPARTTLVFEVKHDGEVIDIDIPKADKPSRKREKRPEGQP